MSWQSQILNPSELNIKAEKMQSFLEEKPLDQEEGLIDRLGLLGVLAAQSGKMLADSKYWLDQRKNDAITLALKDALQGDWSTTIIHKKIDALCKDENFLVNWIGRINASATHQSDALRTIISFRKSQMNMT